VRLHLIDPHKDVSLPSIEGVMLNRARWLMPLLRSDYRIALPQLLLAPGAKPGRLADAKHLVVHRERVAFYEVLR
jgi:hypothetical protein